MMTPKEYAELLDYINEYHSWDKFYENACVHKRKIVKYVQCTCDTRDGKIWVVKVLCFGIVEDKLTEKHGCGKKFSESLCTVENIKNWLNDYKEKEADYNG